MSIVKTQESISTTIRSLKNDVENIKTKGSSTPNQKPKLLETPPKKQCSQKSNHGSQSNPQARIDSTKKSSKPLSSSTDSSGKQISTSPKPTPKRNTLQMQTADFPPDFIGLREMLVQFYHKFSSSSNIDSALKRCTNAVMLDSEEDVQDFAAKKLQQAKVACGVSKLGAAYESYIQGSLVCLGFTEWSTNLSQKSDDLYNVACCILAITNFQQIAAEGEFDNCNVNLSYIMQTSLLQKPYDHFVHYFIKSRYKKEIKVKGSHKAEKFKGVSSKNCSCVSWILLFFKNFPKDIGSHRNDEVQEKKELYVIKILHYWSNKANIFFRKLDQEMSEYNKNMKITIHMRTCVHPKITIMSTNVAPPKGLPIDFHNYKWFDNLSMLEKHRIADSDNVAFLPDLQDLLQEKRHPKKKLSDKQSNKKYCELVIGTYDLSEAEEDAEEDKDSDKSPDGSIDLEEPSDNEEEESDGLFEPGE
ncbi:hypothetical protein O181_004427 [Austropuccinia psidii MF-1]|uniref:Uncharacterized protein n=1 Tax=Austropuccinia psidii MF-1 TaxID=1389203 RepID=A0A9Q3GFS4_9BASI|nr:hypothetical protein [Austropuccinia psidii MF-1]